MATSSKVITPVYKYGSPDIGYFANYNDAVSALPKPGMVVPPPSVVTSDAATDATSKNIAKFDNVTQNLNNQSNDYNQPKGSNFDASVPKPGTQTADTSVPGSYNPKVITAPNLKTANTTIDAEARRNIQDLQNLKATMDATSQGIISNIQAKYASLAVNTKLQNQTIFNGLQNVGIVSGRSRYAPELQSSILSNELSEGQKRLNDLENEKMGLVLQAQSAKDANDFKALQAISDAYDKAHERQRKTLQDMFDNSITLENLGISQSQEIRNSNKDQRQAAMDDIANLAQTDLESIDDTTYTRLDKQLGMPSGFAKKYLVAAKKSADAANAKDQATAQKAYLDVLQNIPAGKEVTFPDGSIVTGMGNSGDIYTFEKENASGKVTIVSFNKLTGETKEYSAGAIGTPSGSGDSPTVLKPYNAFLQAANLPVDQSGMYTDSQAAVDLRKQMFEDLGAKGTTLFNNNYLPQFAPEVRDLFK